MKISLSVEVALLWPFQNIPIYDIVEAETNRENIM